VINASNLNDSLRPILAGRVSPKRPVRKSKVCGLKVYKPAVGELTQPATKRLKVTEKHCSRTAGFECEAD
jgi:hypothetical protein